MQLALSNVTAALFAIVMAAALLSPVHAGKIKVGTKAEIKANAMWFEEAETLERWQRAREAGNAEAFAKLERELLGEREAWRFVDAQKVEIVSHEPEKERVKVKMTAPGRMQGSEWFVDPTALTD